MKFSKKLKVVLCAGIISLSVATASLVFAAEFSADDPLISKSYLEKVFLPNILEQIDAKIDAKITELKGSEKLPEQATPDMEAAPDTEKTDAGISYEVITLSAGQKLVAKEGSLEFILRPGAGATVYSELETNGVAEMTSGTELLSGANVPINAYCLIPRADGRGIICTTEIAYVMVRGNYEIQ